MLAKNNQSQGFNPFLAPQMEQEQEQETTQKTPPENNKGRAFRRLGNVCEIVAGSCLNSAVIFTFHMMQIHPIGFVLAIGTAHFYFTATATGEGLDKAATNIMTGASASLAIFCSLSEPIGEWWEAKQSRDAAKLEIQQMYTPPNSGNNIDWSGVGQWTAIALGVIILFKFITK